MYKPNVMKYLFLSLCACCLFIACKKNDDKPKEPTKTELLTSQSWKYESGGVDQNRDGTIDLTFASTGYLQPCILDNTGTFSVNGTGIADEGATKCAPADPQTTAFTWSFQNNETEMNILGPGLFGLGGKFNVKTLTATSLSISKDTIVTFPPLPPTNVALIVNLKH